MFTVFQNVSLDKNKISLLQARIAFLFEDIMEAWKRSEKSIISLKNKIKEFFDRYDDFPDVFYQTRQKILGKRQPSTLESISETLERFATLEQIEAVFKKTCTGMIVGGSLSYGPFFNVRAEKEGRESSDIDAIFVLDQNATYSDWDNFLDCPYFPETEKQTFIERLKIFNTNLFPEVADVLSHKFHVQGTEYDISIHFFTESALDDMLPRSVDDQVNSGDQTVLLRDYKAKRFPHKICPQTNFEGKPYKYVVPDQEQTEEGFIAFLPSYIIHNNSFHPGIYQNLVLPRFFVFHDRDGSITERMSIFKNSIYKYIRKNYGEENVEERIILSHIRNIIFPEVLANEMKN